MGQIDWEEFQRLAAALPEILAIGDRWPLFSPGGGRRRSDPGSGGPSYVRGWASSRVSPTGAALEELRLRKQREAEEIRSRRFKHHALRDPQVWNNK